MSMGRLVTESGVVIYQSSRLNDAGVAHGFSTRIGGVSRGPFDSLNLGNPNGQAVQDSEDALAENHRRALAAIDRKGATLLRVHQVHGDRLAWHDGYRTWDPHAHADAVLTADASTVASVRIADCVPVLLTSADGRCVAAVHAGWRGVVAGIVCRAVRELSGRTDRPVIAAIGPCISAEAFEVGPEVAAAFVAAFGQDAPLTPGRSDRSHVDLRRAIRLQLRGQGLEDGSIDTSDRCTVRDSAEFFSHRRDQGLTGRMAAMISPRQ